MDVRTLVEAQGAGGARGGAARSALLLRPETKNEALAPDGAGPGGEERRPSSRRTGPTSSGPAAGRPPRRSSTGSPSPSRASRRWRRGCARSPRCPIRSATVVDAWRRPNGIEIARVRVPLGRDRLHLRVAPERHRGRRRALREVGQRRRPAGRQRGHRVQRAHRRRAGQGSARRRARPPTRSSSSTPPTARRWPRCSSSDGLVDLVIPRGGEEFVRWVASTRACPCSSTTRGSCTSTWTPPPTSTWPTTHRRSTPRSQRPSVCNALETLLVHRDVAPRFLPAAGGAPGRGRRRAAGLPADAARWCPARGRPPRPTGTRSTST